MSMYYIDFKKNVLSVTLNTSKMPLSIVAWLYYLFRFGNTAYLFISVAFIQMLKALSKLIFVYHLSIWHFF